MTETTYDVARWAYEYRGGASSETIAARYGVCSSTVLSALRAIGVPIRAPGRKSLDPFIERYGAAMLARAREGATYRELCEEFSVGRMTARLVLKRMGLVRPKGNPLAVGR